MTRQPLILDHVVIGVHNRLDDAYKLYERLGFKLNPRGYHTLGSINHLAIFGENYLELLGFPEGGEATRKDVWTYPAGLNGLAFKTADAAELHTDLTISGKPAEDWKDFSRPVNVDGLEQQARFRTFQLGREIVTNGRFFFCQHDTPQLVWRDADREHPNGVQEITDVFLTSQAPNELVSLLDAFTNTKPVTDEDGIHLTAGVATLHILTTEAAKQRFGDTLSPDTNGAHRFIGLGLRTNSLTAAEKILSANGITTIAHKAGLLAPEQDAGGVALWFRD